MKQITKALLVWAVFISIFCASPIQAQQKTITVSDDSAVIVEKSKTSSDYKSTSDYQLKKRVITRVLEKHNSPMVASVDAFMEACYINNIDCYLVPSIAGLESAYGKRVAPNTNNAFGWGGGYLKFETWGEGIHTVSSGLRERYIGRGAVTVAQIGRIYAPPSTTWAGNVSKLMSSFQKEEIRITQFLDIL